LFARGSDFNFSTASDPSEDIIFSYSRSDTSAQASGIARGVVDAGDFYASGNGLFAGKMNAGDDCGECAGAVNVYDVTPTQ
jgi:hypothetical protein